MYRMYGIPRVHGCTGAVCTGMYDRKLLLRFMYSHHPWRSTENCSCVLCIPTIPGGHAHDYMDVGGRATHDAKAEERFVQG